jgi:hypothetical protein
LMPWARRCLAGCAWELQRDVWSVSKLFKNARFLQQKRRRMDVSCAFRQHGHKPRLAPWIGACWSRQVPSRSWPWTIFINVTCLLGCSL